MAGREAERAEPERLVFRVGVHLGDVMGAGQYATFKESARAERINTSYVSIVLQLTLLVPAIVEAILDLQATMAPMLAEAMRVLPAEQATRRIATATSPPQLYRRRTSKSASGSGISVCSSRSRSNISATKLRILSP